MCVFVCSVFNGERIEVKECCSCSFVGVSLRPLAWYVCALPDQPSLSGGILFGLLISVSSVFVCVCVGGLSRLGPIRSSISLSVCVGGVDERVEVVLQQQQQQQTMTVDDRCLLLQSDHFLIFTCRRADVFVSVCGPDC